MRLTREQRRIIREEVARVFGAGASVRLFGSRLDDGERGGDIDLYIEADGTPSDLLDRELELYSTLIRRLGDRRIDIVVHDNGAPLQSIHRHARRTGVSL